MIYCELFPRVYVKYQLSFFTVILITLLVKMLSIFIKLKCFEYFLRIPNLQFCSKNRQYLTHFFEK
jgi:hypothetical protein